jgi:hypothetical protein
MYKYFALSENPVAGPATSQAIYPAMASRTIRVNDRILFIKKFKQI